MTVNGKVSNVTRTNHTSDSTYDAALDVLFQYFRGEMDFGDVNPGHAPPEDDSDPRDPVPAES